SYNPSWVQILANKDEVKRAGTTLVRAVLEKVSTLPKDKRPKVYLSGESLGAYSGLAALTELSKTAHGRHLVSLVSGQLWAGTPAFTPERVNLE
ncbi:alpha/beta-hydrolase family protein, partial [Aerococcus sp. UMB8623]